MDAVRYKYHTHTHTHILRYGIAVEAEELNGS